MPATWTSSPACRNGGNCASNQVLYHLGSRGIEWQLLPKCRKAKIMVMAYSPLGQGPLLRKPALEEDRRQARLRAGGRGARLGAAPAGRDHDPEGDQPRARARQHQGGRVKLDADDLAALDAAFPPPKRATPSI